MTTKKAPTKPVPADEENDLLDAPPRPITVEVEPEPEPVAAAPAPAPAGSQHVVNRGKSVWED
jgi:hypothetical protein